MEKKKEEKLEMVKVMPTKDFSCAFDKEYHLKAGKELEVPKKLLPNLKAEKAIK